MQIDTQISQSIESKKFKVLIKTKLLNISEFDTDIFPKLKLKEKLIEDLKDVGEEYRISLTYDGVLVESNDFNLIGYIKLKYL